MKSQLVVGVLLLMVGGLVGEWYGGRGDAAVAAQQRQKACLWRVQKEGKAGLLKFKLDPPHRCEHGTMKFDTAEGVGDLELKFRNGGTPCDELAAVNPNVFPAGSLLVVNDGTFIRREAVNPQQHRSAFYSGKFAIKDPDGGILFQGLLEAVLGISPNHAPLPPTFGNEPCDRRDRLEGWVEGKGVGNAKGFDLRAVLVARIDYRGTDCQFHEFTLDGVIIVR